MPPMTGRVVAGRYNLQHPIGRGAMGVVWRARDQLLDRDVAVKEVVISALIGADERRNAYQRTLREARTAARLSHRGVVAIYDVAEEDGRPWIIMELVPSRSLDQVLITERRLTPLRTGRIGQQLLSALAAAHIAGVLHRDVKPSNVLIANDQGSSGGDERAVLTDFGIAQFEGDPRLTQTGMVMGSPGFTAPERIRGGDATPASDLWSLGATLYAAAEGRGPYDQHGGAITTMSAIINEDAPVAVHAGPLGPVIAALLRREAAARPSASAAARMFAHLLPQLAALAERPRAATQPATVRVALPVPTAGAASAAVVPAAGLAAGDPAPAAEPEAAADPGDAAGPENDELTRALEPAPEVALAAAREPDADGPTAAAIAPESADAEAAVAKVPEAAVAEAATEPEAVKTADGPGNLMNEGAGVSAEAGAAMAPGATLIEAAPGIQVPETIIDRDRRPDQEPTGYRPTERSVPAANPFPGPRFTASQRQERAAPAFAATRLDPPGTAQPASPSESPPAYGAPRTAAAVPGPYPGATSPRAGSGGQYAGPSQPHPDLAGQYPPGRGGGRAQRRRGPWRWIVLAIGAMVLAAAIGAGAAFALGHHGAGTGANGSGRKGTGQVTDPSTLYLSVNALNHPSAVIPAGWTPVRVTAAQAHSHAGFTIDLPPGWKEYRRGLAANFYGPDGMFLEIDLTPHTYANMVREAAYIERRSAPRFTGYQRLHLLGVPVRSTAGALWQFRKTSAGGVLTTADDILFTEPGPAGRSQSYAIYIEAPSNGWGSTYLPAFDKILPTFQALPAP